MQQQPQQQQSEMQAERPGPSASVGVIPPTPTPEEDAANLYRAFKGSRCDVGRLVRILSQRDATHRHLIAQHYKRSYDEDLSDRISSELGMLGTGDLKEMVGLDPITVNQRNARSLGSSAGTLKRVITLWLLEESERDATLVWLSLQVISLDKAAVTEVICSRTPSQLGRLKQAYYTKYGSRLLEDIGASNFRFYGYHRELLIACLDDKRDEGTNVDLKSVEKDAKLLYKDGEKTLGVNEKTFVEIFTKRNRPHLAAIDAAYDILYGHSLGEAVRKETSGSLKDGLLTLLTCAKNPAKYFAEVLYNSMKGLGTSDTTLIRVVMTRAGIDLEDIKKEYVQAYQTSLKDAIYENTSGGFRTFLLNLVE